MQPVVLLSMLSIYLSLSMAQSDSSLRGSPSSSSTDGVVNSISDQLEVGPGVAAVIAIICGLIMNTCGYKLLRPTMFACGFLVGGYIVSSLAEYIVHGRTAFWIAYLIGGTIVGSLVVSIYSAGIFIIGAAGGVFLATIINTSFGYRIYPSDPSTGLLIMAIVLGLICGIVAFKVERLAIIVATALVGAVMLVNGVGYYSGKFPKLTGTKDYRHLDEDGYYVYDVPKEWWGYLAAILVVSIFGFFVQIKKTGTK